MNLEELVQGVLAREFDTDVEQVIGLQDVLTFETASLKLRSGKTIRSVTGVPDNYYGIFLRCLTNDVNARLEYADCLKALRDDPAEAEAFEAVIYKAAQIATSRRFGVSYHQADEYLRVLDASSFGYSLETAIELVIENYEEVAGLGEPLQVLGALNAVGNPVIIEGVHRSVINIANDFAFTDVAILKRDPEWVAFVESFRLEGAELYGNPNLLYHAIDHPDFAGFEVVREDRSVPIVEFARERGFRRALDLGAMIGFYSHQLAREGIDVVAVEYESKYAHAIEVLSDTYDLDVDVRCEDVFDRSYFFDRHPADVVLMLSLLYHLLRRDEKKTVAWLVEMKGRFDCFVVDTEVRTGVLPRERLFELFDGFSPNLLFTGTDEREIYAMTRIDH